MSDNREQLALTLNPTQEVVLEGVVQDITFRDDDSLYTIASLAPTPESYSASALVTVTGTFSILQPGQSLRLRGRWAHHPKYGKQLRVHDYQEVMPVSVAAIEAYLASGLIRGIRAKTAKQIVQHFGPTTITVLETEPERLREVKGISKKRIPAIIESWQEQQSVRETILFLQDYGITANLACKIHQEYGNRTISLVQGNPYRLAEEVTGIGFITADTIAHQLGYSPDSALRYRSGILHVLAMAADDGHCFLPKADVIASAIRQLTTSSHTPEYEVVAQILQQMQQEGTIVLEDSTPQQNCYSALMHKVETGLVLELHRLLARPALVDQAWVNQWIEEYAQRSQVQFSAEQRQAIATAATQRVLILTGGPGTGKSLTAAAIYALWKAMDKSVALAAPTGRAASRLGEIIAATSDVNPDDHDETPRTLHRLLEYTPKTGFQRNSHNPLWEQCILIDEASMVDVFLAHALLGAIGDHAHLVLQGDADQLPSVGPGSVLQDLIYSGILPVVRLTQVFRQAQQSCIVTSAHRINQGSLPTIEAISVTPQTDCLWREAPQPEDGLQSVQRIITRFLPNRGYDPMQDVQVLAPTLKGLVGTRQLNEQIQTLLNPAHPEKREHLRGETLYREGDRVIQLKNNYDLEVWNGDLGTIHRIDEKNRTLAVQFRNTRASYDFSDLDQLGLAYALSVHKSQGGEYPVVVFLCYHHPMLMHRSLVYTALTRAQRLAIFVGSQSALAEAIRNLPNQRHTYIVERLQQLNSAQPLDLIPS